MNLFRRSSVFAVLLTCLFLTFSGYAQEVQDEDWYLEKTISQINFDGLKTVKKSELSGITAGYVSQKVNDVIYDLMDRLYALELFDEIVPVATPDKDDGVVITFQVTEKPLIVEIAFRGNKKIRNLALRDAVKLKTNEIFTEARALYDEREIRNLYLEKGFTDVRVSYRKEEVEGGIKLIFIISEGQSIVISKIKFSGNTVFKSKALKKQLKSKEASFIKKGEFQEAVLENDKQAILKYYTDRGYFDSQVIDVGREISHNDEKDRDEITLTFYIQEGNQYRFDGITFVGNSIFSSEKLMEKITLQKGAIFNQTKFNENIMAITDLYYENGYTSNGFQPSINKDPVNKTISFVLTISERDRSHVESIIIRGNTKTKEYVISREFPFESGDVFSKTKLTNGLRNLYNLQYFSSVVPDVQSGSEPNLLNIVVTVDEQMTNSVEFGLTFSGVTDPTELPFALMAKWSNSNLAGTGRLVSAQTTLSSTEQSLSLGYGQNWLFGLPISLDESLSISHSKSTTLRLKLMPDGTYNDEDYYMQYEAWVTSLNSAIGKRYTLDWAILTLACGLTNSLRCYMYDEDIYIPLDTQINEYANRWGLTNSIWAKASLDGRDINYDPTRGWFVSEQIGWYGLTPWESDFYARFDTKLEGYLKLFDFQLSDSYNLRMVLAAITSLSFQAPAPGSSVSDSNKLYIDGMFNARGWNTIYNKVKGRALWSNNVELRVPVVPGILAVDGFFDFAVIKEDLGSMLTSISGDDFYFSFGPDLRVLMPQFPMRFMFANTFKFTNGKLDWRDTMKFVFSINLVNK
ncbi:MAG: outer membrane protein assembly factor BamA [Treponema sp.]|uniref:outer membrane protein assembly factor BamA n=1 Tax=Treponema sp. TaxID=166 RepID=UPI00298DF796|nr:outer membrane protein assembly factor BamA [Treponema sp.]MCR5386967.1 outer membrane protein assembly factor BamA [Treponema sp.]